MYARTIDDVIARLDAIIDDCQRRGDRLGYFAALYNRVTREVKRGIEADRFDDGDRMERFDVLFANRYLQAYDLYRRGELPSRAWLQAFDAARQPHHIVLQHLMAGMNAHINLDLGIAAARTAPGDRLPSLERDFLRINDILAALVPEVARELAEVSPACGQIAWLAPRVERQLVNFSMAKARDAAWSLAETLVALDPAEQVAAMARRDLEVLFIGEGVLHHGPTIRWIHGEESQDVSANIEVLNRPTPARVPHAVRRGWRMLRQGEGSLTGSLSA